MDSNKHVYKQTNNKQTDKQTCIGIYKDWGLKTIFFLHNVNHINHNKDIIKWIGTGLICMDFHAYCHRDLWFVINVHWFQWHGQGSVSGGWPKCLHHRLAPHPYAVNGMTRALRTTDITPHKITLLCYLLTLHDHWCSFCKFSIGTLSHILHYRPFSRWHNYNK